MGTTVLTQFNPSTLKAIYKSATSKQQVVKIECQHCDDNTQPFRLTLTLSGFTDGSCYGCWLTDPTYRICRKAISVATTVNGNYQLDYAGEIGAVCRYQYVDSDSHGTLRYYDYLDPPGPIPDDCTDVCTGTAAMDYYDWAADGLRITADLTATGINIKVELHVPDDWHACWDYDEYKGAGYITCFEGVITYGEGESCGNTENNASNDLENSEVTGSCVWYPLVPSGQVSVSI